jgi:hypothetical protein
MRGGGPPLSVGSVGRAEPLPRVLCKGEGLPRERSSAGSGVAIIPRCVVRASPVLRGVIRLELLEGLPLARRDHHARTGRDRGAGAQPDHGEEGKHPLGQAHVQPPLTGLAGLRAGRPSSSPVGTL